MIENLFVIFPPGGGGNHLANIVSTSPRFVTRFTPEVYEDSNRHKTHPIGGKDNIISENSTYSTILAGQNNTIGTYSYNSVILGGSGLELDNESRD